MLRVAVFVALGACVDVPQFISTSGVSWKDVGKGGTMTSALPPGSSTPFVQLGFATAEGTLHFPDSLRFDGVPIEGRSQSASCGSEDLMGIGVYPAARASASTDQTLLPNNTNFLDVKLRGPAATTAILQWGGEFKCGDQSTHDPGGYSIFTMFPNGQIVRYDELAESDASPANPMACSCNGQQTADHWITSTFWTFATSAFDHVLGTAPDPTAAPPIPTMPANELTFADHFGCIESTDGAQSSIQIAWANAGMATPTMPERIRAPGDATSFAIVHDLDHPLDVQTVAVGDARVMTSLSFHPTGSCSDRDGASVDFIAQHPLSVDSVSAPMGQDGIYGGFMLGVETTGVPISDRSFSIIGPTHGSFAVWLHFSFDVDSLKVTKGEGQMGTWFVPQQIDANQWILWFRDTLEMNQTIDIETR